MRYRNSDNSNCVTPPPDPLGGDVYSASNSADCKVPLLPEAYRDVNAPINTGVKHLLHSYKNSPFNIINIKVE